jgi:hypothetical protein
MSKLTIRWDEILNNYKESGLPQRVFCEANSVSFPEFQYRWNRENRLKKLKVTPAKEAFPIFEVLSVVKPEVSKVEEKALGLVIHLPNAIRCELRDLGQSEFIGLLKAMVNLC